MKNCELLEARIKRSKILKENDRHEVMELAALYLFLAVGSMSDCGSFRNSKWPH